MEIGGVLEEVDATRRPEGDPVGSVGEGADADPARAAGGDDRFHGGDDLGVPDLSRLPERLREVVGPDEERGRGGAGRKDPRKFLDRGGPLDLQDEACPRVGVTQIGVARGGGEVSRAHEATEPALPCGGEMTLSHRGGGIRARLDMRDLDARDPEVAAPLEIAGLPLGDAHHECEASTLRGKDQRIEIARPERGMLHIDDREVEPRDPDRLEHLGVRTLHEETELGTRGRGRCLGHESSSGRRISAASTSGGRKG